MRDILDKPASCSVYISAAYDKAAQQRLWDALRRKLNPRESKEETLRYNVLRLPTHKRPANWKPVHDGLGIVTQAERARMNMPPSDVIVIAHQSENFDSKFYDGIIAEIKEIRAGHPDSLIAVHLTQDGKTGYEDLRCRFAFNARAAGAALIYAAEPYQKESARDRKVDRDFKTMLDALVRRAIRKPITTPAFIKVTKDPTIRLGDILITRKLNARTPGSVINGHTNTTLTGFRPQSIQLLWALAAHQGTYFDHKEQEQFPHFSSSLRTLQEDLGRKRLGKVHTLYNLGYVVEGEDFRIHTYAPGVETKDYPFQYHRAENLLVWGPRQVKLTGLEGTLFEKLMAHPGVTMSKDQLVSGHSDTSLKVAMSKLRSKLDGLSPVNPHDRISLQFIETNSRFGWRMMPAGELRALVTRYSEKQRLEASSKPALSARP